MRQESGTEAQRLAYDTTSTHPAGALPVLSTWKVTSGVGRGNEYTWGGAAWIQTHFSGSPGAFASAKSSGAVTKSDSTVLDFNALYVGGAGDVSIDHTEGGDAVVYVGVPAGSILPVAGVRVNAATTATNIVWMKW